MAGGSLEALFQSKAVKAWFIAYADLLIAWKPFHFNATIGISLGAAVQIDLLFTTVTLSFELGATLNLWGPPTAGVVHVHLYIISFSVPFGTGEAGGAPPPLDWPGFQNLLPQPSTRASAPTASLGATATSAGPIVLGAQINRGLTKKDSAGTWYVRADELTFTSETAVPATSFSFGSRGTPSLAAGAPVFTPPATINIRPMAASGITSVLTVTLTSIEDNQHIDLSTWRAPLAPGANPAPSSATIPGLPTGVQLIAPTSTVGTSPGPMNIASLTDLLGGGYQPLTPSSQSERIPAPVIDTAIITTIINTLGSSAAQTAQQGLVAALASFCAAPPTSALLTNLAKQAGQTFSQAPLRAG